MTDLAALLARHTVDDAGCLRWTGAATNGSPVCAIKRHTSLVRRVLWAAQHGPIPAGRVVRCTCETPLCVTLEHIELSTRKRSAQIAARAGKMSSPVRAAKIAATKRATVAKIDAGVAGQIRASEASGRQIAEEFGLSLRTVQKIQSGEIWKVYGSAFAGLGARR